MPASSGRRGFSVEDFQTHPHDPWVPAHIEHAGEIRSRIASETTYGRSGQATASRTWAPAETPEASTVYKMPWVGHADSRQCRRSATPELRAAHHPSNPSRVTRCRVLVSPKIGTPR